MTPEELKAQRNSDQDDQEVVTSKSYKISDEDLQLVKGSRVLIVDDSPPLRHQLVKIVSELEAEIDETDNGENALRIIRTAAFNGMPHHLLLTDLKMPVMDGFELLKVIRMDTGLRTMPVVVVSSMSEEDIILKCARYGISSYITRPTKPFKIRKAVVDALACSMRLQASSPSLSPEMVEQLQKCALAAAEQAIASGISKAPSPQDDPVVQAIFGWLDNHRQAA